MLRHEGSCVSSGTLRYIFVVVLSCPTSFVISPFKDPQGVLEVEEEVSQTHFHYIMTFCLCQLC